MNKLHNLIGIIKAMNQQVEFIETCYNQGLCTDGEALDAINRLKDDSDAEWIDTIMSEQIKDNMYQGIQNN